jgi:hypothetical protein
MNIVQLQVKKEAHPRRPHRHGEGIAHARRAMGQEKFQSDLYASHRGLGTPGNGLNQLGSPGEIGRVDAAIYRIGAGFIHGGAP